MLKESIDYLDPVKRHLADGLIIRADIYLAAHGEPGKEKKEGENNRVRISWKKNTGETGHGDWINKGVAEKILKRINEKNAVKDMEYWFEEEKREGTQ